MYIKQKAIFHTKII